MKKAEYLFRAEYLPVSYTHLKHPKAEPFVIDGRSNFLFVNHKGKPKVAIDYNALFVRMVKKYNKQHKDNPLPHITPHTLRHTFCTRLASKNMNPKDLQYIMGHSNISITMNWYAHASIDTAKSEVQRLICLLYTSLSGKPERCLIRK